MRIPIDTALIVIDMQDAIADPVWGPRNNPDAEHRIAALIGTWREASMPIVHVRHDSIEPHSPYCPGSPGACLQARDHAAAWRDDRREVDR